MKDEYLLSRISKAREIFDGPYNCAQAVASAFADIIGDEEEEIRRLVSGFGFGMGGERSVCGALSGGIFVLSSTVKDPTNREELYDRVYYIISQFKKNNDGNLHCLDLIGEDPGEKEFKSVCPLLVETVVRLVAKSLP
jgi:C_GCAxxG_C_C family probable redox protein